ncbi:hypothetical protein Haur_3824 [Herpetosiphon aurantiacus DSM 785]|uniref:Uncharacterized protein n=2 Tax=Herpetosiphon TaxID=64 RepID=A9B8A7_HERA2|nr:hypothetical protein Haur_3824 [Herpetosiphon aurantiacus DSM 785]
MQYPRLHQVHHKLVPQLKVHGTSFIISILQHNPKSQAGAPIEGSWNPNLASHLRNPALIRHAIVGPDQNLYIAGAFSNINNTAANGLARWDGSQWHSLATSGADVDRVQSMAFFNNKLTVGGAFRTWAGQPFAQLVQWDGADWMQLGSGFQGSFNNSPTQTTAVNALTVLNTMLIIGGNFTQFHGQPANGVVGWNATDAIPFGSANGQINMTVASTDTLMIHGDFRTFNNQTVPYGTIPSWKAGIWKILVLPAIPSGFIYKANLISIDQTIYLLANESYFNETFVFRWQNERWVQLGTGLPGQFTKLTNANGSLYLAQADGDGNANDSYGVVLRLVDNQWQTVNLPHSYTSISQLVAIGSDVYIIGLPAENQQCPNLVCTFTVERWNGTTLQLIGEAWQAPSIVSLVGDVDHVWATSRPTYLDRQAAPTVLFWNGQLWQGSSNTESFTTTIVPTLFKTADNSVYYTTRFEGSIDRQVWGNVWRLDRLTRTWNPNIDIGGWFGGWNTSGKDLLGSAGSVVMYSRPVDGVLRLRSNVWSEETSEFEVAGACDICVPFEVNGEFYQLVVRAQLQLIHWNGSSWDTLNSWENSYPVQLTSYPVVVWRGDFYLINGRKLQRYNLTTQMVEDIALLDGDGYSLATFTDQYLYVGGAFSSVNGIAAQNLARWNGTQWQALSQAPNGPVYVIATSPNYLYIAGNFSQVGTTNSLGVGVYHLTSSYQVFAPISNK